MSKRRDEQKQRTRAAILAAAQARFTELGYDKATVATIAKAAGVAAGTVYVHFKGKDDLIDALRADFNLRLVAALSEDLAGVAPGSDAWLERFAATCLDRWYAERGLLRCFVARAARSETWSAAADAALVEADPLRDGINPEVARFLAAALAARAPSVRHPALVIQALLGLWTRVCLQYLFHPDVTRDAAVETLVTLTRGAVRAAAPELWEDPA